MTTVASFAMNGAVSVDMPRRCADGDAKITSSRPVTASSRSIVAVTSGGKSTPERNFAILV